MTITHRLVRTLTAGAAALALAASFTAAASAAADDQDRLDAAMEAFNERMTAAGWTSTGLPAGGFASEDDEDDLPLDCFGEFAVFFEDFEDFDEFPGETARSFSEEFEFAPPSEETDATEEFSFDFDFEEEDASAFALTVDESSVENLSSFVEMVGSDELEECFEELIEAEMAADADDDIPMMLDISVSTEADLGVGEESAALGIGFSGNVFGIQIELDGTIAIARVDRTLVAVTHFVVGESTSGFDPIAELQAIIDTLSK